MAVSIGDGAAVDVCEPHADTGKFRFVGTLQAITVHVDPGGVADRSGLDSTEVDVNDRARGLGNRHVRGVLVAAVVCLGGLCSLQRSAVRIHDAHPVVA